MTYVALDVDGTLAKSLVTTAQRIEGEDTDITYDDFEDWDWPVERWGNEFFTEIDNVWRMDWMKVDPLENGLNRTTRRLVSAGVSDFDPNRRLRTHIVTSQPMDVRLSQGKKHWLERHGIRYDSFVPVDRDKFVRKGDFLSQYDIVIDDKPTVPERVADGTRVYLRDQPYNQDADGDYIRVDSVSEAVTKIEESL